MSVTESLCLSQTLSVCIKPFFFIILGLVLTYFFVNGVIGDMGDIGDNGSYR